MDRYRVIKGDHHAYLCTLHFSYFLPIFNGGEHHARAILDSLAFCRRSKGLVIYAYVLMIDHLHLIARHEDLGGVMRDFKTWTSRIITAGLEQDGRQRWLDLLETRARTAGSGEQQRKLWEDGFRPKRIQSNAMFLQKIDYVHHNPVRKGFVARAEDWRWSSAGDYFDGRKGPLEIDRVDVLIP